MKALFTTILTCMLLVLSTSCTVDKTGEPPASTNRPNILFIMSDDHSTSTVGCYNSWLADHISTPNIDRLAAEGMRFENCFATNSLCTPSRASILTGQYGHLNGVPTLDDTLTTDRDNVAKMLQRNGYQTAVIGKWHLKVDPSGFDYWNVLPGQGRYHDPIMKEIGAGDFRVFEGFSTDVVTDLSIDWLKNREDDKPFMLMTQYKAPHRAWDPADKYADLYEDVTFPEPPTLLDQYKNRSRAARNATLRIGENMDANDLKQEKPADMPWQVLRKWGYQVYIKDYLRCIVSVDENVGKILDYLDESGLSENTVVIYTSDQGMFVGEHGYYDKRFMYEPSIQMPLIIRQPGTIQPGSTNDDIVLNLDFPETFLDLADVAQPASMQGASIVPLLQGSTPADWRTSMYYRYWMHQAHHTVAAHYGIRTDRYKLIFFYGLGLGVVGEHTSLGMDQDHVDMSLFDPTEPEWELFDLEKDPQELNNVYDDPAYADVIKELKVELQRLKKQYQDTDERYPELMQVRDKYWE
jgi:arylsulfatase A-like enzyme